MSAGARRKTSPSVSERWAGRLLAAGLAGGVALGTAALGSGVAVAAPALTCPKPGSVLPSLIPDACKTVSGATGGVASVVPKATAPVKSVVPKATAPVKSVVPKVVTVVPGAVTPPRSKAAAAAPSKAAPASAASAAPASAAPAAPVSAAAPAAVSAAPAVMSPAFVSAFGRLPASFLAGVGAPGSASVLGALGPVSGRYDPGLLLSSARPLRALAASPVTTTSSAMPLDLFPGQGRVGTPVLLSVLSVAVLAALAVRGGVLRRARRRASA